jgi:hypothetical protein
MALPRPFVSKKCQAMRRSTSRSMQGVGSHSARLDGAALRAVLNARSTLQGGRDKWDLFYPAP